MIRNELLCKQAVAAFRRRHFDAYYCADREAALQTALELIGKEDLVSWGGTLSASEIGLFAALNDRKQPVLDRATAKSREEAAEIARRAVGCDYFVMSANGASVDGQLVNMDGNGNRVAALCFGPRNVLVILGVNKLCPDLESAVRRVRFEAAPINCERFEIETPCRTTGKCEDCLSPDSICSELVITRLCRPAGRIKVLVVNAELGF